MDKNRKISQDLKLLMGGIVLMALIVTTTIWAFAFLINNVMPAITENDVPPVSERINFDIEGFEELNL